MAERRITVENAYMQQNYLIQLCMGYTDRLNELETKYHKIQAENWRHRAKQLKSANSKLYEKVDALQRRLAWYRGKVSDLNEKVDAQQRRLAWCRDKVSDLKAENQSLRDKLEH